MQIREYIDLKGKSAFRGWFKSLSPAAQAKVAAALSRMEDGNVSNVKSVGLGVVERRIDWGPGYRIYFGREGDDIIVLLGGGTKKRQGKDIVRAQALWTEYKTLKRRGR